MPPQPVLTPRSWAIGAAAAVFSLGFGVLAVASALGMGEPAQPGLFTFRAATVGDGMQLPLLAYSLVRSCEPVRHWSRGTRRAVALGATVGVIAGAGSQASWLANPHPKVNWTFPSAGTFNGVGWYHAAFLVIASGFFAGATIAAVARLRKARSGSSVRSIGVLGTLVPALGFVALLGEDNGADLIVVMAEVVALASVATGVLVWAVGGAGARWCALVTASAILPAISLSLLFLPGSTVNLTTVLPAVCAALAGAFGASVLKATNQVDRIAMPLCAAVCSAGPVHAFAGAPTTTLLGLAAGCVLGAVLVVLELVMLRSLLGHSSPTVRTVLLLHDPARKLLISPQRSISGDADRSTKFGMSTCLAIFMTCSNSARLTRRQPRIWATSVGSGTFVPSSTFDSFCALIPSEVFSVAAVVFTLSEYQGRLDDRADAGWAKSDSVQG
ncbi:hypothetical protein ACWEVP_37185 [Amycolatopsis sp. NPDC003865]